MSNTGGPAFPSGTDFYGGSNKEYGKRGLTLRDYFAAKAMQMHGTALSNWGANSEDEWHANVSRLAYLTADAMLAARSRA